jgi:hypothetical protein
VTGTLSVGFVSVTLGTSSTTADTGFLAVAPISTKSIIIAIPKIPTDCFLEDSFSNDGLIKLIMKAITESNRRNVKNEFIKCDWI